MPSYWIPKKVSDPFGDTNLLLNGSTVPSYGVKEAASQMPDIEPVPASYRDKVALSIYNITKVT
jgi:hypothetical protein